MKTLLCLFLLSASLAMAQNPPAVPPTTTTDPTGLNCAPNDVLNFIPSGQLYTCKNGVFAATGGSGGAITINGQTCTVGSTCTVPGGIVAVSTGASVNAVCNTIYFNQDATAAANITYTLPTASAGCQVCIFNSYNGSAPTTGTLEFLTSASGQFLIFTDGTLSATGGNVISAGAARDGGCVIGTDSTHWQFYALSTSGVPWTKN